MKTLTLMKITVILAVISVVIIISGCQPTLDILEGSTHACGDLYVEGYATDSQGTIVVAKAPAEWTPEMLIKFCNAGRGGI